MSQLQTIINQKYKANEKNITSSSLDFEGVQADFNTYSTDKKMQHSVKKRTSQFSIPTPLPI